MLVTPRVGDCGAFAIGSVAWRNCSPWAHTPTCPLKRAREKRDDARKLVPMKWTRTPSDRRSGCAGRYVRGDRSRVAQSSEGGNSWRRPHDPRGKARHLSNIRTWAVERFQQLPSRNCWGYFGGSRRAGRMRRPHRVALRSRSVWRYAVRPGARAGHHYGSQGRVGAGEGAKLCGDH